MIGATASAKAVSNMLNSIRHKAAQNEIDAAYTAMIPTTQQLIDGLKNARHEDNAIAQCVVADVARCMQILSRLEGLLESGDMSAGALAHDESLLLQQTLGNAGSTLLSAIQVFDFELALKELQSVSRSLAKAASLQPQEAG